MLFVYILGIIFLLFGLRFLWILFFCNYEENLKVDLVSRLKNIFFYIVVGVCGIIILVSVFLLFFVFGNGNVFFECDLFIFIVVGVIIMMLFLVNFILLFFVDKKDKIVVDYMIDIVLFCDIV